MDLVRVKYGFCKALVRVRKGFFKAFYEGNASKASTNDQSGFSMPIIWGLFSKGSLSV